MTVCMYRGMERCVLYIAGQGMWMCRLPRLCGGMERCVLYIAGQGMWMCRLP